MWIMKCTREGGVFSPFPKFIWHMMFSETHTGKLHSKPKLKGLGAQDQEQRNPSDFLAVLKGLSMLGEPAFCLQYSIHYVLLQIPLWALSFLHC
jgi:hypothetical protein